MHTQFVLGLRHCWVELRPHHAMKPHVCSVLSCQRVQEWFSALAVCNEEEGLHGRMCHTTRDYVLQL